MQQTTALLRLLGPPRLLLLRLRPPRLLLPAAPTAPVLNATPGVPAPANHRAPLLSLPQHQNGEHGYGGAYYPHQAQLFGYHQPPPSLFDGTTRWTPIPRRAAPLMAPMPPPRALPLPARPPRAMMYGAPMPSTEDYQAMQDEVQQLRAQLHQYAYDPRYGPY